MPDSRPDLPPAARRGEDRRRPPGGHGHRRHPPRHRGPARRRPARRPRTSSRTTTSSTGSPWRSRSSATRCWSCSSPWPVTCASSSPRCAWPSEIERSGDLVVNVAKAMRRIYGDELDPSPPGPHRADERGGGQALQAGHRRLPGRRRRLWPPPSTTWTTSSTSLQKDFIEAIFAAHEAERLDLQAAVQLALIGRYYERIGDHAVNIGERVQYMVTGWLPEHGAAALAEAREKHRPGPVEAEVAERVEEG